MNQFNVFDDDTLLNTLRLYAELGYCYRSQLIGRLNISTIDVLKQLLSGKNVNEEVLNSIDQKLSYFNTKIANPTY